MCSDTEDQDLITDERKELIRDRKENFQQLADDARSSNRFQLIVAGFAASLTAVLVNNDLLSLEQLVENRYILTSLVMLSLSILISFLTFHSSKKRIDQQSKLLFDDVLYNRYRTHDEVIDQLRSDAIQETFLRWMIIVSGASTIVTIFSFIFGIVDVFINVAPLVYVVALLLIFGSVTYYMIAVLASMIESIIEELKLVWKRKEISDKIRKYVCSPFISIISVIHSYRSRSASDDNFDNELNDGEEDKAKQEEGKPESESSTGQRDR